MTQSNHKKVVWDAATESYKVVSNPEWDIETEISIYSSLVQEGVNDALATDIVSMFNTNRPVYACYCYTNHQSIGYTFNPCPCADCETIARIEGFNITEPIDNIQLHKNTVHVVGSMIKKVLPELNELIAQDDVYISEKDFKMFQSLLRQYGQTDQTWSQVIDSYQPQTDSHYTVTAILEYFWIAFVLNNPKTTGHRI